MDKMKDEIKRIITQDCFNKIGGCYFENFQEFEVEPVVVVAKYEKQTGSKTNNVGQIKQIDENLSEIIHCRHSRFEKVTKIDEFERGSVTTFSYTEDPKLWDTAIDKFSAFFNMNSIVQVMVTISKDKKTVVKWKRASTENGQRTPKLLMNEVNGASWEFLTFDEARFAAGLLHADHCIIGTKEVAFPLCQVGSH